MMNLLYTNQENKEEKTSNSSLSKSQLSQQSPLISILPTTNLELGKSTTTYITTTIKNHIENVSFLCKLCFVLSCYV